MATREPGHEASERRGRFADHLRALRQAAGLTQEELALRAGLSPNAVSTLERGQRKRPYPHTVRSLAEALELSEDERAALLATVPGRGEVAHAAAETSPTIVPPTALPHPTTSILGRERELEELVGLLARSDVRMLTLTGVGGVGKTRLAVEVARRATELFAEGTAFVGLAPLRDPSLVAAAILQSLGLGEDEGRAPSDVLRAYLHEKRLLLVLDNFEHLLGAAGGREPDRSLPRSRRAGNQPRPHAREG